MRCETRDPRTAGRDLPSAARWPAPLRWASLAALVLLAITWLPGCHSPPIGAEGSIAWVQIDGCTTDQIRRAAMQVLPAHGYLLSNAPGEELMFEKLGDRGMAVMYGGLGSGADLRIRLSMTSQHRLSHMLQCRAWAVRNRGDRLVEEEQPIKSYRKSSFKELLEEIKARAVGPAPATGAPTRP